MGERSWFHKLAWWLFMVWSNIKADQICDICVHNHFIYLVTCWLASAYTRTYLVSSVKGEIVMFTSPLSNNRIPPWPLEAWWYPRDRVGWHLNSGCRSRKCEQMGSSQFQVKTKRILCTHIQNSSDRVVMSLEHLLLACRLNSTTIDYNAVKGSLSWNPAPVLFLVAVISVSNHNFLSSSSSSLNYSILVLSQPLYEFYLYSASSSSGISLQTSCFPLMSHVNHPKCRASSNCKHWMGGLLLQAHVQVSKAEA